MAGMASVLFLYGAGVLLAPWWAVALLLTVWLVLFVLACRWWTTRPGVVAALPVGAAVLWFVVMLAGGFGLGWTWNG